MNSLIVCIGYGNEHQVFPRAKNLWSHYHAYFPSTQFVAIRSSSDLMPDEFSYQSGEYVFGLSRTIARGQIGTPEYETTGSNIDRLLKLYEQLLIVHRDPFWLYCHTVTSCVDYGWLSTIISQMNCRQTYAGCIGLVKIPEGMGPDLPANKYLRFVSGAGILLSSDLLKLVLERAHLVHQKMQDDLWLSLVLRDIPRTPFMRYDLTDITTFDQSARETLRRRISKARADGHFHFRVKSGRWEAQGELNHDPARIDPLVINETMLEILSTPTDPINAVTQWTSFVRQVSDVNGRYMSPLSD